MAVAVLLLGAASADDLPLLKDKATLNAEINDLCEKVRQVLPKPEHSYVHATPFKFIHVAGHR